MERENEYSPGFHEKVVGDMQSASSAALENSVSLAKGTRETLLPVKGGDEEVMAEPVSGSEKYSSYPSRNLTPSGLGSILSSADNGKMSKLIDLYEEMEEKDAHYYSVVQTRKLAVAACDWVVMPAVEEQADDAAVDHAKEVAQFVQQVFLGCEGFDDALLDLMDGVPKGYAVDEVMWDVKDGRVVPSELRWRHQRRFCISDTFKFRYLTEVVAYPGLELPENKFVIHQPRSKSGYPTRAGVGRVCAWLYLFANYGLKDWVQFTELFGMPLRVGYYKPGTGETEKSTLRSALTSLGTAAAAMMSDDMKMELLGIVGGGGGQRGASGSSPHEALINACHRLMSKAVLGQVLTTEEGQHGTQALGKVHQGVRQDILEADTKALSTTITEQLVKPIIRFNFGPDEPVPMFWLKAEAEKDLRVMAEVDKILVTEIGVPLTEEYFQDAYGRPAPKEGEKVVVPPGKGGGGGPVPPFGEEEDEAEEEAEPEVAPATSWVEFAGLDQSGPPDEFSLVVTELAERGTQVQTLIFDKAKFPTEESVRKWVRDHDFKVVG